MIVVDTQDTLHVIKLLPRYYNDLTQHFHTLDANLNVEITNEDTRRNLTHNVTDIYVSDGDLYFTTDASFKDNTTYRIKVTNSDISEVIFRGKIFATKQNKQNYLINE